MLRVCVRSNQYVKQRQFVRSLLLFSICIPAMFPYETATNSITFAFMVSTSFKTFSGAVNVR